MQGFGHIVDKIFDLYIVLVSNGVSYEHHFNQIIFLWLNLFETYTLENSRDDYFTFSA